MRDRADALALTGIVALFALAWPLVAASSNVPVVDDYAYAWSVEHLLKTGHLAINDRSSIYPIVQIVWGALFARVFGFSFGVLRCSTVCLSAAGCCAIYLTLRELALDARVSLVAALTVALYPAYFVLSFTFMTDVPFVSLSAIALYFYVSGLRRDNAGRVWWGTAFAVLAFLVRQVGIVLPLAPLIVAGRRLFSSSPSRRLWLPVIAGPVMVVVLWFALPRLFGPLPIIGGRAAQLPYLLHMSLDEYAQSNAELLWIVTFPLTPLLICQFSRARRAALLIAATLLLVAGVYLWIGSLPEPLSNGQTWSLQDLAMRTNLMDGDVPASARVTRLSGIAAILGTAAVAAFIASLLDGRGREWSSGRVLLVAGLLELALINALWVYYDRYYLILLPTVVYVAAIPVQARRLPLWPALLVLPVWAFISVTGTRDVLVTNAIGAAMVRDLEAQGVAPFDIDAGYASNGWRLYVHPENLPPGRDPHRDVPFVSTDTSRPYRVVTIPPPGYDVVRSEKLRWSIWQVTDSVSLVHQHGPVTSRP